MADRVYRKGQRVSGHVAGLGSNAAFVALPDGTRGIVRRRELSWESTVRRPDELFSSGQEVEAVVIGRDPRSGRLELSLRLAQRDPWEEFAAHAQRGQIVRGVVTQVMPYGAFVEIEPGIVGLVHISEIAPWRVDQVEDALWTGDYVEAVILKVEKERRRVALSIQSRLEQLSPSQTRTFSVEQMRSSLSSVQASVRVPIGQSEHKIRTVLVADDEPDLREAMCARMRRRGYQVEAVDSGEAAVRAANERRFDVALMDVNFAVGIDGIQAAQRMARLRPGTTIIFVTGVELTQEQLGTIRDYQAVGPAALLYKPLRRDEIDETLAQIESGQLGALDFAPRVAETPALAWVGPSGGRRKPLSQQLVQALQTTSQQTGVTAAVFHLDPDGREVEMLAQAGDMPVNFEQARHHLADSPVGDVVLGGELILENDVKGREGKYRHLLMLLNFGSCIGVPMTVWDEVQHALFFFHGDADHFAPLDQERALAAAARLGALVERFRLGERMEAFQRLSLQGQLTSALAHEVNNKLSTVEMELAGVLEDFQSFARQPTSKESWMEIDSSLRQLTRLTRQTLDTVGIFQGLMRSEEPRTLDVNRIVRDAVEQLRPLGRRHAVIIQLELLPELPPCPGLAPRLRQACLNVALNAIQQISRKTATGGLVTVRTFHEPRDEWPIKISFRDDGPGIHRRDFERIFDMDYSTRGQEGTGLGLYVTRGLIEAMGGRVYVTESYVLVGTTFLIELPVTKSTHHEPG